MKFSKSLVSLCLVALLAALLSSAELQLTENVVDPLVVVSKTTNGDDVVLGRPLEVTVTVTNYGQSPAFDVEIVDILEDGQKKTKSIASLPYGASEVLRYTVVPKSLGQYPIGIAHVSYQEQQGSSAAPRKAMSNMLREGTAYFRGDQVDDESFRGFISVLTQAAYERKHARYIKETIAYVLLGVLPAVAPYVLYRVKQSQVEELRRRKSRK